MAAHNFKIFFDSSTGIVNRAVICDGDDESDANLLPHLPADGEDFMILPRSTIPTIYTIDDITAAFLAAQAPK